jgi:hypothetical protein
MVAENDIPTVPIQDVIADAPKRRGPGRPRNEERGLPPAKSRRPSKRNTRRATTPRKPSTRSLKPEISAFLTLANQLVLMSPLGTRPFLAATDPNIPAEKVGDELDAAEIAALAAALDAQAMRSPRFRKYLERALGVGASGQLFGVLGIIAVRRAARHGIAPPLLDVALGAQLAGMPIEEFPAPEPEHDATPDATTGEIAPDRSIDFDKLGMEP